MRREVRPRRRGMVTLASLADVIFLLLLYFILTTSFSRLGEIELASAPAGTAAPSTEVVFLRLTDGEVTLNGRPVAMTDIPDRVTGQLTGSTGGQAVVAPGEGVTAQDLTDVLVQLRKVAGLRVQVIG